MTFHLAHLSDAHIGPLPVATYRELFSKRITGFTNWNRHRSRIHNMPMLGSIVADLRAHHPDHIAMTGDILNLGLAAEFLAARRWLESVGTPEQVSFTPGNHDAYTPACTRLLRHTFAPYTSDQPVLEAHFPYMRRRGPVALIGLGSGVPTAPFLATGTVGQRQAREFEALLLAAREEGLVRVVLIHHPPWRRGAKPGRHLTDAARIEAIIARSGAELVLHGHNHRQQVHFMAGPRGPVPCIGVASASAIPGSASHRAAWHMFAIDGTGTDARITATARGLLANGVGIGDLGQIDLDASRGERGEIGVLQAGGMT